MAHGTTGGRLVGAVVLLWCLLGCLDAAAAPRVQVRGGSRIDLRASGPSIRLVVAGTVRDEVGAPVAHARLVVAPYVSDDVPVAWTSIAACGEASGTGPEHTDHTLEADDSGSFCAVAALDRDHARVRATFAGDMLHEGSRTEVEWDAAQQAGTVSFSPRPDRIDLDAPRARIVARMTVPPEEQSAGLRLQLGDEAGRVLGDAITDEAGFGVFEIPTAKWDHPGVGELRVKFPGSQRLTASEAVTSVTRVAKVKLIPQQMVVHGDPSSGLLFGVKAQWARGGVTSGFVEALVGSDVVGTGAVRDGEAEVAASFAAARGVEQFPLSLRYASDAPYFEATTPVFVTVRPKHASTFSRIIPLVIAAGVAAWVLRGWRRPKRREAGVAQEKRPTGVAALEVVRAAEKGTWHGRVIDAHDGAPVQGARIRVIAPSFVDTDVVLDVQTDERGEFRLALARYSRELKMHVDAPLHTDLDRALPPPSEIVISLVSRRRVLLQRLVDWAKRHGKPWDAQPEPTPGQIREVARTAQRHRAEVGTWAEAVERGAYGADPVTAREEREVRGLEPGGQAVR